MKRIINYVSCSLVIAIVMAGCGSANSQTTDNGSDSVTADVQTVDNSSEALSEEQLKDAIQSEQSALMNELGKIVLSDDFKIGEDGKPAENYAAKLDYGNMLNILKQSSGDFEYSLLVDYLKASDYSVDGLSYPEVWDMFIGLSPEEQAIVLSNMFSFVGYKEYSEATDYSYYIDGEGELLAEAENLEKRYVPIYISRAFYGIKK